LRSTTGSSEGFSRTLQRNGFLTEATDSVRVPAAFGDTEMSNCSLDIPYLLQVREYYESIGASLIAPHVHILIDDRLNIKNPSFLPDSLRKKAIWTLNSSRMHSAYSEKTLYPVMVRTNRQPRNVLRCASGAYFDDKNRSFASLPYTVLENGVEYIIKPSGTNDGEGVRSIIRNGDSCLLDGVPTGIANAVAPYGKNFVVQERIRQHPMLAQIHPRSVNTLRLVTLRWKGKIHFLGGFARFGTAESIKDNAGTGGICIGIDSNGCLMKYAVDIKGQLHYSHPTTGFDIRHNTIEIPNYESIENFVVSLHEDILHHDFVSWDIAVGTDGQPIFLEYNFGGVLWLYQLATGEPIFRELSDEVLPYVVRAAKRDDPELRAIHTYIRGDESPSICYIWLKRKVGRLLSPDSKKRIRSMLKGVLPGKAS
jgi:hypothetical protein